MSPIYQQGSSSCPRLNLLAVRFNTLTPRLGAGQRQLKGTLKSMVCILIQGYTIRREGDQSAQEVWKPLSGQQEGGPRSQYCPAALLSF